VNSIGDIRLLGLFDQTTRIFCTLSIFFSLYGQSFAQDSSAQTLQEADEGLNWDEEVPGYGVKDTNYVLSLFDLADLKETSEKVRIYQDIYEISNELNYKKGIVVSLFRTAKVFQYELGKLDTATILYNKALNEAVIHDYKPQWYSINLAISNAQIHLMRGNHEKSIDLLVQTLDRCDSNYVYEKMVILFTLSSIHQEMGNKKMHLEYMRRTAELIDEDSESRSGHSHIYSDYAIALANDGQIDLALIQIKKARVILDEYENLDELESIYWHAVNCIQRNAGNHEAAVEAAAFSYEFAKKGNRLDAYMLSLREYLGILNKTDSKNEFLINKLIQEGDSLIEVLNTNSLRFIYLEEKHKALTSIGEWNDAYQAYIELDSIQQIIHQNDITEKSNQLQKEIADLESQKALVAREKELVEQDARLAKSNLYFTVSIFGFLLIITIGLLFFMRYRTKTVLGKLQLENKLLRVQINPHFIYNVLANIKSLIFEAPEKAESYTLTFARLLRKVLEQSREEFIPLSEELQLLQDYVTLQETRLNKEVEYIVELDEDIIANEISIPPLVLQPLVENAVEHGFRNGVQEHYILEIRFILQPKYLEVQVIDNGPGIGNIEKKVKHRSLATQIIRDQIEIFRKTNRSKVFDLIVKKREEIEPGTEGTIAVIRIPFKKR